MRNMEETYPNDENATIRLTSPSSINKSDHVALLSSTQIVDDKELRPQDYRHANKFKYRDTRSKQERESQRPKTKIQMLNHAKLISEENPIWFPKAIKAHDGLSKTWAPY